MLNDGTFSRPQFLASGEREAGGPQEIITRGKQYLPALKDLA